MFACNSYIPIWIIYIDRVLFSDYFEKKSKKKSKFSSNIFIAKSLCVPGKLYKTLGYTVTPILLLLVSLYAHLLYSYLLDYIVSIEIIWDTHIY